MAHQQNGLFPQPLLKAFSVLIFHILLKDVCNGQPQLIGPSQALVARAGDDVILPCHLEPAYDVSTKTLEWTRSSLDPRFVYVSRASQELEKLKNPSFKGRTSLFVDELKYGNISLKISKVKFADTGTYKCFIPDLEKEALVKLVVASDAATSPIISLSGIDKNRGGVVLQCESAGWYPEPELLWLDGEGNLLSAGPTETLRGPDDLYTVSSTVTVEKRHSNNITCRVQQRNTNQSRETHIHVPDEFFELTSCSAAPIVIALAVSLAVSIILILIGVFFIWRQNKTNVRRAHCPESDKTERDQEKDKLMSQDIVACEKNHHAAEEKLKEEHRQLEKKDAEISNMKKECEKNQHAAEEKLKEEHRQLEKKDAEISNMKKEPDTSKPPPEKSQTSFEEQNKSDSANHSSKTGDITLVEVEKNGSYIFLKNTSSENKLLSGWKLKLQINNRESAAYKFKENFILKAGETLLLKQDAVKKPIKPDADLVWIYMVNWNIGDDVKIDLISNTGEEQMLFKNKIM
ncbi:butyrophilin subfamily 3 member A2-like [Astatotilapia calliptera]|uniref:butyrophilin subfamily 3 member A2-like n=1 Tax=Astatotilapia calliptera TaxID=8154 RepID=UPI000E420C68|nr:butyrophilin subfamily 3 member A2-like [Astatotilapia calliptera]